MNINDLSCLKEIANNVRLAVMPLIGTFESRKVLGRGFGGDRTLLIDEVAENSITKFLEENGLSCIFIGEERGVKKFGEKPTHYMIVDAVDGTTNATRGVSFVSTSLAVSPTNDLGSIEVALVMNLCSGETFEAKKGEGAKFQGKEIKTSETLYLKDAILGVDVSRAPNTVELAVPLMKKARCVRAFGSASLEICHVASGFLDAYVDLRGALRTLDIAAALLIVKEAGGTMTQHNGAGFNGYLLTEMNRFSVIAAANKTLHRDIFTFLAKS
ncbi:MAG: inositol monophosphatase family protein [Candidatus Bathyarchaeia archaeon]